MEQQALAPTNVEYIKVSPHRKRLNRRFWLLAFSSLLLLVGALAWYYTHDQTHHFKKLGLPTLGLETGLKAKWVDGAVRYVFVAKPLPGNESAFNANFQGVAEIPYHFEISLLDKDGFKLCSFVPSLVEVHGKDALITGLKAEEKLPNCTEGELANSKRWDVTYRGPRVAKTNTTTADKGDVAKPNLSAQTTNGPDVLAAIVRSKLTGSDFESGDVETLAGSFKVTRAAEYMTLASWRPGDDLQIDCQKVNCIVTNTTSEQSVHVRKK